MWFLILVVRSVPSLIDDVKQDPHRISGVVTMARWLILIMMHDKATRFIILTLDGT